MKATKKYGILLVNGFFPDPDVYRKCWVRSYRFEESIVKWMVKRCVPG